MKNLNKIAISISLFGLIGFSNVVSAQDHFLDGLNRIQQELHTDNCDKVGDMYASVTEEYLGGESYRNLDYKYSRMYGNEGRKAVNTVFKTLDGELNDGEYDFDAIINYFREKSTEICRRDLNASKKLMNQLLNAR